MTGELATSKAGHDKDLSLIHIYTMAYQISYDAITKRFNISIDGIGNIIQVVACLRHLDSCEKASLGSLHQASCFFTDLPYRESTCHVGMIPLIDQSCIQTYNITLVKNMIFVRNTCLLYTSEHFGLPGYGNLTFYVQLKLVLIAGVQL